MSYDHLYDEFGVEKKKSRWKDAVILGFMASLSYYVDVLFLALLYPYIGFKIAENIEFTGKKYWIAVVAWLPFVLLGLTGVIE